MKWSSEKNQRKWLKHMQTQAVLRFQIRVHFDIQLFNFLFLPNQCLNYNLVGILILHLVVLGANWRIVCILNQSCKFKTRSSIETRHGIREAENDEIA